MLDILFEPTDIIEIRCLHKDQIMKAGRAEPAPQMFWGTYEQLRKRSSELHRLNSIGYNIYFGVNPRAGQSKTAVSCCRSLCVDIDHRTLEEAEEWLNVLQTEWQVPYPSVIVSSGNGVHYYWRLTEQLSVADWHKHQKALICTLNLSGKIADPVIHDAPRIMRLPGFVNHKGGNTAVLAAHNYDRHPVKDFVYCLDNFVAASEAAAPVNANYTGDNANALERALRYHELRAGAGEGGRNTEAYKIAACCQNDFGLCENDTYHVISVWNQKNSPPLPESEIREVITKSKRYSAQTATYSKDRPLMRKDRPLMREPAPEYNPAPEPAGTVPVSQERNMAGIDLDQLSYMVENYVLIAGTTEVWDLEHGIKMPSAAMSLLYPMEFKFWKTDPARQVILAENLVFEPSGNVLPGQINTFRGLAFKEDSRPVPLLMSHLEMLCGGDQQVFEWVLSWCAHQVQKPGEKMASSIIMHGPQGTGKSMFWDCFGQIFGEYFATIDQAILDCDFNGWASCRMFVLAEEVMANRELSKQKNIIKQMVTGKKIQINQKNIVPWFESCYMNMVFLSNNNLPMLLDEDDRRFMVIWAGIKEDAQYYTDLAAEIADNGPARLYTVLKSWDLQGFNPHTKPITTEAKKNLIAITRDTTKNFLDEWLNNDIDGLPCCSARKQDLYDGYLAWCKTASCRANSRNHFYRIIEEHYPTICERKTPYSRYFCINEESDLSVFSEALYKFIGKVQDRKV